MILALACAGLPLAGLAQDETTTYAGGMSVLLEPGPGQWRDAEHPDRFQVVPGTPLRATFGFVHSYPEAKTFRVFVLLNYQQIHVGFREIPAPDAEAWAAAPPSSAPAGPMVNVLEFSLEPETERYVELWTEPLPAGYADLALIVVPDPELNQRELPYFTVSQFPVRASVYIGSALPPSPEAYPPFDPAPVADGEHAPFLWIGPRAHTVGLKSSQPVAAGAEVTLTLNYRVSPDAGADDEPADTPVPVAMVAVLDDRVVPINGQPVWFGSAVPGQINALPITVQAPAEPGAHQLFVQQFPNPYTDTAEAEATGRSHFGVSSQRIILDVE